MKPLRLRASNFFSFGSFDVAVPDGITVVVGKNDDSDGTVSNGVGKSTLLDAMLFVLFGDTSKKIPMKNVVRSGECDVEVCLDADVDGRIVSVGRLWSERDHTISISEKSVTGVVEKTGKVKSMQAELLRVLGLPAGYTIDDFLGTNYFSNEGSYSFVSSKPADRTRAVESAVNAGTVDRAIKDCQRGIAVYKDEQLSVDAQISILQKTLGGLPTESELQKLIVDADSRSIEPARLVDLRQRLTDAADAKKQIQLLETQLKDEESRFGEFVKTQQTAVAQLATLMRLRENVDSLNTKRAQLVKEVGRMREDVLRAQIRMRQERLVLIESDVEKLVRLDAELSTSLTNAEQQLKQQLLCPSCGETLMSHSGALKKFDALVVERSMSAWQAERQAGRVLMGAKKDDAGKFRGEIESLVKMVDVRKHNLDEIASVDKSLEAVPTNEEISNAEKAVHAAANMVKTSSNKCENLESQIEELSVSLSLVGLGKIEEEIRQLSEAVDRAKEEKRALVYKLEGLRQTEARILGLRNQLNTVQNALRDEMSALKTLIRFRSWLMSGFAPEFEYRANSYLSKMEYDYTVRLSTTREKSDGGQKPEITITVFDGIDWRPFESFSKGEKTRIALACQLALMDIAGTRRIDVLMIDEILDAVDPDGFEIVMSAMRELASRVVVTSRLETSKISEWADTIISLRKRLGVSSVERIDIR